MKRKSNNPQCPYIKQECIVTDLDFYLNCKNCQHFQDKNKSTLIISFLSFIRKFFLSIIFLTSTIQLINIDYNSIDLSEDYVSYYKENVQWDLLYNSIVIIESNGNNYAVSSKGAVGQIQSLPKGRGGYLDEANRILGINKYENIDLHNPVKAREIWDTVMKHHNPEKSINKAIKMHNPRAGDWYKQRILKVYNKLIEENNQKIKNYVKKRS